MAVAMYPSFPGSMLQSAQSRPECLETLPKVSSIHFPVREIRNDGSWRRQGVVLHDYFRSCETVDSFD
jgi:hypothetical protein